MATLDQLQAQTVLAVAALPGATRNRLASDYDEDCEATVGNVDFQVRAWLTSEVSSDSAQTLKAARVEVVMIHRLASPSGEQVYTSGTMASDMSSLISLNFWKSLAAVHSIILDSDPGVSVSPELRGSSLVYSVIADVALAP